MIGQLKQSRQANLSDESPDGHISQQVAAGIGEPFIP
jgi:hypothetical protein